MNNADVATSELCF